MPTPETRYKRKFIKTDFDFGAEEAAHKDTWQSEFAIFIFEAGSYVVHAGLQLTIWPTMTLTL
jgi:hypothetical protein